MEAKPLSNWPSLKFARCRIYASLAFPKHIVLIFLSHLVSLIVVNDPTSDISSLKQSARILWGIKGIIKSSPLCQQGWLVAGGPPSLLKHSQLLPAQHHLHLIFFLLISTIMTDQRQNNEKIAAMTSQPLNRAVSDGYLTAMQTWTFSVSSYSNK